LAAVLICLSLISGITSSAVAAAENSVIVNCFDAFKSAEPIFTDLQKFIKDEIESDDDDDAEFDENEALAMLDNLQDYVNRLEELISKISGPKGDMDTSEGKTVKATRDYLDMLKNMSYDLNELVAYSLDFIDAVWPMGEINEYAENYEELADDIYINTGESMELLNKIKPPSYLAITHGDLSPRVKEFQDFAEDFYIAAALGDPLRIYSCLYRLNRMESMFTKCGDNLNSDIQLQLLQAERRLNGPLSTLREELSANFALLKVK
jgi:cytochrome c556